MLTLQPPAPEHDLSEEPPPVLSNPHEDISTGLNFTKKKYVHILDERILSNLFSNMILKDQTPTSTLFFS